MQIPPYIFLLRPPSALKPTELLPEECCLRFAQYSFNLIRFSIWDTQVWKQTSWQVLLDYLFIRRRNPHTPTTMILFTTAPFKQTVFPWQRKLAFAYIFFSLSLSLPVCDQLTCWSLSIVVYVATWRLSYNALAAYGIVNCNSFSLNNFTGWFLKSPKSLSGFRQ